jgi:hypothetical protein
MKILRKLIRPRGKSKYAHPVDFFIFELHMRTADTSIARMSFDETKHILHIEMKENAQMDMEATVAHYEKIIEVTGGKKYLALIDSGNYFHIDSDALELTSRKGTIGGRVAAAHYNVSVANKLTTHFFRSYYKLPIPFAVFESKEEALKWLLSLPQARKLKPKKQK